MLINVRLIPPPCSLRYIYIYTPELFVIPKFNQADRFRSPLVSAYGSYFRVKHDRLSGGKKTHQHQLMSLCTTFSTISQEVSPHISTYHMLYHCIT